MEPVGFRARLLVERLAVRRRMELGEAISSLWKEVAELAGMVQEMAEEKEETDG